MSNFKQQEDVISDYPETHKQGHVSLENLEFIKEQHLQNCDFGMQISADGRVWVCINGIAFIRFKPFPPSLQKRKQSQANNRD